MKHASDGGLATLPSGSEAVAATAELCDTTRDLGLESRAGVRVGQVERRDHDLDGIAVDLAARVMSEADLVVSAAVALTDRDG